jgi:hypothetical protein
MAQEREKALRKISDYTGKNVLAKPAYKGMSREERKSTVNSVVRHIYHERKKHNPKYQIEE